MKIYAEIISIIIAEILALTLPNLYDDFLWWFLTILLVLNRLIFESSRVS